MHCLGFKAPWIQKLSAGIRTTAPILTGTAKQETLMGIIQIHFHLFSSCSFKNKNVIKTWVFLIYWINAISLYIRAHLLIQLVPLHT